MRVLVQRGRGMVGNGFVLGLVHGAGGRGTVHCLLSSMTLLLLPVVALAFCVEAVVGFGATVLAVTLGAQLVPISTLLPAFVPLNLGLSTYLCLRERSHIDARVLGRSVLPLVGAGAIAGMAAFALQGAAWLLLGFALFVGALALFELRRALRPADPSATTTPLPRPLAWGLLLAGGFVHGLFGSGGPMIVYVLGRSLPEKRRFRATLACLWLLLNLALMANLARLGHVSAATLGHTVSLLPALALGAFVGDWVHHRVAERPFRIAAAVLLLVAAGSLGLRTALAG